MSNTDKVYQTKSRLEIQNKNFKELFKVSNQDISILIRLAMKHGATIEEIASELSTQNLPVTTRTVRRWKEGGSK